MVWNYKKFFGTTKRFAMRELSMTHLMLYLMYQYHLQAAKVVDHRLHVNNKRRADEKEAKGQEQYLTHYEPLIIETWALRLLKTDKNRTIISTEHSPHRCGRCRLRDLL